MRVRPAWPRCRIDAVQEKVHETRLILDFIGHLFHIKSTLNHGYNNTARCPIGFELNSSVMTQNISAGSQKQCDGALRHMTASHDWTSLAE